MSYPATDDLSLLTEATPRIARLREHALAIAHRGQDRREGDLAALRSWRSSSAEQSHLVRRGLMARDILCALTPVIGDDELIVGNWANRPLNAEEAQEFDFLQREVAPAMSRVDGQRSHMSIDYECLLREGVHGLRALIARYREPLDLARAEDQQQDDFYRACLVALDGMTTLAEKYADLAEQSAHDADPARAEELREIARLCRAVPAGPATTFAEAMQSIHFATFCMCAGNQMQLMQLGRPDRYLWPYYQHDLAAGRITRARAQELIDCLSVLLTEYTGRGLAVGWMVGGRDAAGCDVTNELSYLLVQTIGHVRLAYPGVGVCWHADTPPALTALSAQLLARGYSHPALFNDDVITQGLRGLGLSYRDACLYIHSTCVEITPIAMSNVYVASPYHNLMQVLHDILGIPPVGGEVDALPEIASFDALLARYRQRLEEYIRVGAITEIRSMRSREHAGGFPLLSCFVNDCLARGKDIDQGGARANWVEPSFVGLANTVDALAAIRTLVFEEGTLTLARLRAALLADFAGYDDVRAQLGSVPKYGNDDDRVDALAPTLTEIIRVACQGYRTYWGGPIVPGFFCWQMHEALGRQTLASADGRAAGFPFADGSGPAQGREHVGPTAMIRSVTKWDHTPMIGGIAVNMRFQPGRPEEFAIPLQHTLETFLTLGGCEAQVNVVDTATLRAAQAHPEQYRDLVVRIAGYSDFFVGLSSAMQSELIARSELALT